jgi:lysine 2,3-aminomutase
MDPVHASCPIRMQGIPAPEEDVAARGDLEDPIGEEPHRPARAVVHKYADRVLFLLVDRCAVYCRHCTRRRITFSDAGGFDRAAVEEGVAYVRAHPEVRDVIVSGGDPLVLGDERLLEALAALRAIPHVQLLRLATRAPVTCPMRITDALAAALRRLAPLFVITHFNHPRECTPDAREACERLVDHGVPVENQSVLLRGLNSSARLLLDLNQTLLTWRVRPYYLHQGDLAAGTGHLRTPLSAGVAILEALRGRTSGLAIPHLAVDLPGGGGKVTLAPDYRVDAPSPDGGPGQWFRNHRGERRFYPAPPQDDCACPYEAVYYGPGGAGAAGPGRG